MSCNIKTGSYKAATGRVADGGLHRGSRSDGIRSWRRAAQIKRARTTCISIYVIKPTAKPLKIPGRPWLTYPTSTDTTINTMRTLLSSETEIFWSGFNLTSCNIHASLNKRVGQILSVRAKQLINGG